MIVYQVDRGIPSPRGYRYLFYGNGFFINADGYLLTAAHVLSQLHGGQPYLLIRDGGGQPQFVRADVVAVDNAHDVAILHAIPNPFAENDPVSFLPLAAESVTPGEAVATVAKAPAEPRDAYSLDAVLEKQSLGNVLQFAFSKLTQGVGESELFLLDSGVWRGQSGAPAIADRVGGVAGLVEGEWLRGDAFAFAPDENKSSADGQDSPGTDGGNEVAREPGAILPIHYAIALLQRKGIAWHAAGTAGDTLRDASFGPPMPLSLVAEPYPETLSGGEVVLDALVGVNGTLSDVRLTHGDQPFVNVALDAVHTWTFYPAHSGGEAAQARIAIIFQFPQPYMPSREATVHNYSEPSETPDAAADPLTTVEAEYPERTQAEGSVILDESINREGKVEAVKTISGAEPLAAAALRASDGWRFAPAKQSGAAVESAAIVVVTFRRPLTTTDNQPTSLPQSIKH